MGGGGGGGSQKLLIVKIFALNHYSIKPFLQKSAYLRIFLLLKSLNFKSQKSLIVKNSLITNHYEIRPLITNQYTPSRPSYKFVGYF